MEHKLILFTNVGENSVLITYHGKISFNFIDIAAWVIVTLFLFCKEPTFNYIEKASWNIWRLVILDDIFYLKASHISQTYGRKWLSSSERLASYYSPESMTGLEAWSNNMHADTTELHCWFPYYKTIDIHYHQTNWIACNPLVVRFLLSTLFSIVFFFSIVVRFQIARKYVFNNKLVDEMLTMGGKPLNKPYRYLLHHRVGSENGYLTLCPFWSGIGYGFWGNYGSVWKINRFNSKWVRKEKKYANSKWIWRTVLFVV